MMTDDEIKLAALCLEKFRLLREPLIESARKCGYALTLHGSLTRDIDLVAITWVQNASSVELLVETIVTISRALNNGVAFMVEEPNASPFDFVQRNPEPKAHGRLAFAIHLGGGPYIDLSVMPPTGER